LIFIVPNHHLYYHKPQCHTRKNKLKYRSKNTIFYNFYQKNYGALPQTLQAFKPFRTLLRKAVFDRRIYLCDSLLDLNFD